MVVTRLYETTYVNDDLKVFLTEPQVQIKASSNLRGLNSDFGSCCLFRFDFQGEKVSVQH